MKADRVLAGGAVQRLNLVTVPLGADGAEVVTRRAPGHPPLQLDHIVTSSELAGRVGDIEVHPAWQNEAPAVAGLADHAPVLFTLRREP